MVTLLFLLGLPLETPVFGAPATERPPWILLQGEQRFLNLEGLERFSIGGPAIRAIRSPGRPGESKGRDALLIKGVQPGVADLLVWTRDGKSEHRIIRVESPGPETLTWWNASLSRSISTLEEAQVWIGPDGLLLRGEIQSWPESVRIATLKRLFPLIIRDETVLDPSLWQDAGGRLERWLGQSTWRSTLRLEPRGGRWVLLGAVESAAELERVRVSSRAIFPALEIEVEALPDSSRTIHFKVLLLEMRRTRARALGLNWPDGQEAAFRVSSSGLQNQLQLDAALKALESDGSIRVLSEPELVVRAPGEAELFSGGELPIEQKSHFFSNIQWKPVGLSLKLKVTQATLAQARIEISTETSHLDPSLASEKTPGIRSNRMKTQIDASFGVPLLLSGLLQQEHRASERGIPGLREIPLVGSLFGTQEDSQLRTELVAILVPTLNPPQSPLQRVTEHTPRGATPWPRDYYTLEQQRRLKASPDYPWNILGGDSP